ncbi:hypothetical protein FRUB_02728 [Fimbriiglobus ruber]|uniref:Alginate export domain-containing protein n=1 Tax=Fimbriiglobus ruber TaxID=1908690 RepID=A0A225E0V3_9BACT|nr:hypothetical protein FRUB_02728 [Fimbriiglobus ruber]
MPPAPVGSTPATPLVVVDPSAAPTPTPAADGAPADDIRNKVPPVRPLPRPGNFPILPTGPGYYSALDMLTGDYRQAPPKYAYPRISPNIGVYYDADFRYLDDPKNTDTDYADPLKRIRIGDNWLLSTGGELRNRYMSEYNSRLTANNNNYDLARARLNADLWYGDSFRVFAEFIGAYSSPQNLAPLPTDINKADFLNLFVDVKIFDLDGKPGYVRVGRQELALGSQRLVSPLDWSNTLRTFQGVRATRTGEDWDADLFWVKPMVLNPNQLDSWDDTQDFAGGYLTYHPTKTSLIDGYYLMLDSRLPTTQLGLTRGPFTLNTFGSRYAGNQGSFLWDFEGAMQLGTINSTGSRQDVVAGMATAGLGYNFKDVAWNPTLWLYYDYASGGNNGTGTDHTFNQLFPFGHYYLGWTDLVGRQNIQDLNLHLYLYPTPWITLWIQYHHFWLADSTDALYNKSGVAYRRDATGAAGNDVGQEVDFNVNFHLTKHVDIFTGYSYLFGGEFLKKTAGATGAVNASSTFVAVTYKW